MRSKGELKALNDIGIRPVAHIVARNSGVREKDAPVDSAGGLARQTYLRRGPRCVLSPAVWQEWGIYNGAIGEVVDIIYRPGERPPRSLPSCILVAPPKYCGPVCPPRATYRCPMWPHIERIMDCVRRCSRTTIPLIAACGITFHKSHGRRVVPGATQSALLPGRRSHPSKSRTQAACTPRSPELSHPGAAYMAILGSRHLRFTYRLFAAAGAFLSK